MGVYILTVVFTIPCIIFLVWTYTPRGKQWMHQNDLL
jgi:hypothetical protein